MPSRKRYENISGLTDWIWLIDCWTIFYKNYKIICINENDKTKKCNKLY